MAEVLTNRQLNRALLARQGLLERSNTPVADMVEHLVGMQAQVPSNPYVALWSRLSGFDPGELSAMVADRRMVRAALMRGTLHLVTARDCLAIQPLMQPMIRQLFQSQGNLIRGLAGADIAEVSAGGLDLLDGEPRSRAEMRPALLARWPDADAEALTLAVTYNLALVQTPPRGQWGKSGVARWLPTERFLGAPLDSESSVDDLVLRYLAAFGPATVGDIRTWSRLTELRPVVERLRPQLVTFRDEAGRELFDVPGAPLPDPDIPAPPRLLPEYDNLLLSHEDRSRVVGDVVPAEGFPPRGTWVGSLLLDGYFRAFWRATVTRESAVLTLERFLPQPDDAPDSLDVVEAEALGLLGFIAPKVPERRFKFARA